MKDSVRHEGSCLIVTVRLGNGHADADRILSMVQHGCSLLPIPKYALEDSIMSDSTPLPVDQRLDLAQVTRSEFVNAMIHLYRGELGEATAWRPCTTARASCSRPRRTSW